MHWYLFSGTNKMTLVLHDELFRKYLFDCCPLSGREKLADMKKKKETVQHLVDSDLPVEFRCWEVRGIPDIFLPAVLESWNVSLDFSVLPAALGSLGDLTTRGCQMTICDPVCASQMKEFLPPALRG